MTRRDAWLKKRYACAWQKLVQTIFGQRHDELRRDAASVNPALEIELLTVCMNGYVYIGYPLIS